MRRLIISLLVLLCSACATEPAPPPSDQTGKAMSDYTGTAMFTCGPTDGPASNISMSSQSGESVSMFAHDMSPEYLKGEVMIDSEDPPEPSARLEYCPGRGAPCIVASKGTMTISGNDKKTVTGRLRFATEGSDWREIQFTLDIVAAPQNTICG
jgi:hypothetical protein